jgi:hypothetical protein
MLNPASRIEKAVVIVFEEFSRMKVGTDVETAVRDKFNLVLTAIDQVEVIACFAN